MRRSARYAALNDENSEHSNHHELTTFKNGTTYSHGSVARPSDDHQTGGNKLHRFYSRAIIGVLGPYVICAYFAAIWRLYIVPADTDGPFTFGHRGATWIFYSWFVAGVLGLGLSVYGLEGVEAGMLMEPQWNVRDAARLMLHADHTWSGPGGWLKTMNWTMRSRDPYRSPPLLWFMLAIPSMIIFVAWPLSGLTMDFARGHRRPQSSYPTTMIGFSYDTFNERSMYDVYSDAAMIWKTGRDAQIPGAGIVYTPKGFDRSKVAWLNDVPSVLPKTDGVPTIFLAGQALNPTQGNIWGLLLQYNCSIVSQAKDFQMINRVDRSRKDDNSTNWLIRDGNLGGPRRFEVGRWQQQREMRYTQNADAVAEVGIEFWPGSRLLQDQCYFKENRSIVEEYPGIDHEYIFEIALWQGLQDDLSFDKKPLKYDMSIDHEINDYSGIYAFDARNTSFDTVSSSPMTAIGVQCKASSSVGMADINGIQSTYSNFQRTDTRLPDVEGRCGVRLEAQIPGKLMHRVHIEKAPWLSGLFRSSGAPPPYASNLRTNSTHWIRYELQPGYLQAEQLRKSMLHAYASHAVQLIYNGGQIYTFQNGSQSTGYISRNATEFVPGTVIKPGVMPAVVPAILFGIWALISSALNLIYGFRRRWTETLGGHTMFRLGAELQDRDRGALRKTSNIVKEEDSEALVDIPALVGDTKHDMEFGRIGLVKDRKANKKKLYE